MTRQIVIAGGGIGGLAAGLACVTAGWRAHLCEQAKQFSEVGAGIQLGPNATRILRTWGLEAALSAVAVFPGQLRVRSAIDGAQLGLMRLGADFVARYGAPYATLHRADLQGLLLEAARGAGVDLHLSSPVTAVAELANQVKLQVGGKLEIEGDALIGADGLWSKVRDHVCGSARPVPTGHLAYRGLALQHELPLPLRSQDVTVWLGPRTHVVAYPVRRGEQLNVVAIVHGRPGGPADDWDQEALAVDLQFAMGRLCSPLQDLVRAVPGWRLWALNDRAPMRGAQDMARGRIALLGDAAHPMRPYLAQGAGMALEDAAQLGRVLSSAQGAIDVPAALHRYAENRWRRGARVQRRSRRNGKIFHATGPVRWGRDVALGLLGERLLDVPWLYRDRFD